MESSSKLGRRVSRFSNKTIENISRIAYSTYEYQDLTLYSHSTGYRRTNYTGSVTLQKGLLCGLYAYIRSKEMQSNRSNRLLAYHRSTTCLSIKNLTLYLD
ncbi:hypothetical protein TNIN_280341 [Trichonephila inaurata madagascariensis]|uniref:Uncharacterized protein n=1 Tax=Trichonephila inaurata madagascariensis TaxID=2747483 RepID=A0A8X6XI24_9ARAC|nr:hypothetical protein TNIN_280341 [Trichonephila inaurata madagascariensis]